MGDTPTFKYFQAKINGVTDLTALHKKAMGYIAIKYPAAERGSNFISSAREADKEGIPVTDQYFLRIKTFRCCIPPYQDNFIDQFEKRAEEYVREHLMFDKTCHIKQSTR